MTTLSASQYLTDRTEIDPILNLIKNTTGASEPEIMRAVGYSSSYLVHSTKMKKIRRGLKYALLGFATETKIGLNNSPIAKAQFTFDELSLLFQALLSLRRQSPGLDLKLLMSKVAQERAK